MRSDSNFPCGDSSFDQRLDISDSVTILLTLFHCDPPIGCSEAKDSNDRGKVNLSHAVFPFVHLYPGRGRPLAPFPDAGKDPTRDELHCIEHNWRDMTPSLDPTAPLWNQVALVTGAGRGIGRAVSLALARAGAHVILAARTPGQLADVERQIGAEGGKALAVPADVSDEASVIALFERVKRELGRLDILVNNAGVGAFGPVAELPVGDLDRVLAVNVRGTFLCSREALKLMRPRRSGYVVNMASVVGFRGYANQGAYSASKHAVMGLTKSLAIEAQADGIRVSAVLPGGVDTEMIGDARPDLDRSQLLQPVDIARTVLFLLTLSEQAAIDEIYIRRRANQPF